MKVDRDRDIKTAQAHLISIERQTEVQQEPRSWRDRIPIVARSGPDRGAIGIPKRRNRSQEPSHGFGRQSFEHQAHDRGPIVVRYWPDRGFFFKQN